MKLQMAQHSHTMDADKILDYSRQVYGLEALQKIDHRHRHAQRGDDKPA